MDINSTELQVFTQDEIDEGFRRTRAMPMERQLDADEELCFLWESAWPDTSPEAYRWLLEVSLMITTDYMGGQNTLEDIL